MLDSKEENVEPEVTKPSTEEISETKKEVETTVAEVTEEIEAEETIKEEVSEIENEEEVAALEVKEEKNTKKKVVVKKVKETEDTVKAVAAVEDIVAEDAEKDESSKEAAAINYDTLTLEELTDELEKLIKTSKVHQIKSSTEAIKSAFNIKFGTLLAEKKAAFLAEGGNSIDFQFSSPIKSRYNQLLSDYKKERDTHYANLEKQLKDNLEKRVQVIEDLKSLIENADAKTMYKTFKDIQNSWRAIGPVPKTKYNDTWKIYHHHVERFYDLLHLSNDFRDLDFKNNLEEKLQLIKKAEFLAEEKDINVAFKELQKLHKLWKEDIGPVAKDMREDVWEKFSAVTKKIHDKRHDHFRDMKSQYGEIVEAKLLVIEEIKNFDTSKNKTHNDWQKSIKDIEAFRQKYFEAGKLPYSKSESVWQKFKDATKLFNQSKNKFYKQEKNSQQDNLQAKLDLIKLADSMKDSEDWEIATNTFKKIQSDWKEIGHVPRKFSDDIWKKFKAACNHFFDRYHNQKNKLSTEQQETVDEKTALLEGLKTEDYTTKETISDLMNVWSKLGASPRSARAIDTKFNKFIDGALSKLDIDKNEIVLLKFKNIVNGYLANNDVRKLESEIMFIRKKIDENVREIQQLENNLSFFSNASDDNPLVKSVHKSIQDFKDGLDVWKKKLAYLRTLEY
tara:strand:- start:14 stop:2038 length:2025 start_codon:yes stop_codon:yes gene_type:complete